MYSTARAGLVPTSSVIPERSDVKSYESSPRHEHVSHATAHAASGTDAASSMIVRPVAASPPPSPSPSSPPSPLRLQPSLFASPHVPPRHSLRTRLVCSRPVIARTRRHPGTVSPRRLLCRRRPPHPCSAFFAACLPRRRRASRCRALPMPCQSRTLFDAARCRRSLMPMHVAVGLAEDRARLSVPALGSYMLTVLCSLIIHAAMRVSPPSLPLSHASASATPLTSLSSLFSSDSSLFSPLSFLHILFLFPQLHMLSLSRTAVLRYSVASLCSLHAYSLLTMKLEREMFEKKLFHSLGGSPFRY